MRGAILFLLFILIFFFSCSKTPLESPSSLTSGQYDYQAFNADNEIVASGTFTISIIDSLITGNKNIQDSGSEHQLESGEGNIRGRVLSAGKIEIYLYETGGPYLYIEGSYDEGTLSGSRIAGSATGIWFENLGKFRSELLQLD